MFVYGGCKGNQNNFVSEIGCLKRCGDPSEISSLTAFSDEPQLQEIGKIWSEIMAIPEQISGLLRGLCVAALNVNDMNIYLQNLLFTTPSSEVLLHSSVQNSAFYLLQTLDLTESHEVRV